MIYTAEEYAHNAVIAEQMAALYPEGSPGHVQHSFMASALRIAARVAETGLIEAAYNDAAVMSLRRDQANAIRKALTDPPEEKA